MIRNPLVPQTFSLKKFDATIKHELVSRALNSLCDIKDATIYFLKGEEHRLKGELAMAISYYERALTIDPEHENSLSQIGNCYTGHVDSTTGIPIGDDIELDEISRYKRAASAFRTLLEIRKKNDSALHSDYYYYAVALYYLDEYNECLDNSYRALQIKEDHVYSMVLLALAKHCMGLHEEALNDCKKAIELAPRIAGFFNTYGIIQDSMGSDQDAIESYLHSLELNCHYAYAYIHLNRLYRKLQRYEDAAALMEQAIEINADCADFYYCLAITQEDMGMNQKLLQNYREFLSRVNRKFKGEQEKIKFAEDRINKLKTTMLE